MKYLVLFMISFCAFQTYANAVRCDALFPSEAAIRKAAYDLAAFKIEISTLSDTAEKNLRLKEFDAKFLELVRHGVDSENFYELFSKAMARLQKILRSETGQAKQIDREKVIQQEIEKDKITPWMRVKKIDHYESKAVQELHVTPDGSTLFTRTFSGGMKAFDLNAMKTINLVLEENRLVSFTGDKTKMVTVNQAGETKLIDLATMKEIVLPHEEMGPIEFSITTPDGSKHVLIAKTGQIRILDLHTQNEIPLPTLSAPENLHGAVLNPDGTKLMAVETKANTFKILDLNNFETQTIRLKHANQIYKFKAVPKSPLIVFSMLNSDVVLFDMTTHEEVTLDHLNKLPLISVSNEGHRLVSFDIDGNFKIWDLQNRQLMWTGKTRKSPVDEVLFSPDDSKFTVHSASQIQMFDTLTSLETFLPLQMQYSMARIFTPDERKFISADTEGNLFIWFQNSEEALK